MKKGHIMKKFLLTVFAACLPLSAFAESSHVDAVLKTMAFYDANHERIACDTTGDIIICTDENEKPYSGDAYAEEKIDEPRYKAEFKMSDGEISGPVRIFEDGQLIIETYYIRGLQEGLETNYYPDGKTYLVTGYLGGKLHGLSREYDQAGTLISLVNWKDNKQDGEMKEFYPNGNLKSISAWKDDVQHGISVFYGEDGRITEKTLWFHGKVVKHYSK